MDKVEVTKRVNEILMEQLGIGFIEEIGPDKYLIDDYGMDSLDAIDIVMYIEEEFDIELNDSDLQDIKTVQDVIDCVEKTINKG